LVFIAAVTATVAVWFGINWIPGDLIPFLKDPDGTPINPNAPAWIITKLFASALALFLILRSRLK